MPSLQQKLDPIPSVLKCSLFPPVLLTYFPSLVLVTFNEHQDKPEIKWDCIDKNMYPGPKACCAVLEDIGAPLGQCF